MLNDFEITMFLLSGTVTGIINGSGSVTAALGQLAIPYLWAYGKDHGVGYRYVWYFLIVCTVTGTSLMGTKILKELYPQRSLLAASVQGYGSVNTNDRV